MNVTGGIKQLSNNNAINNNESISDVIILRQTYSIKK